MEKFENINNISEKEDKLKMIPEDFNNLPVQEAFRIKHVVFEANECFEKTKLNLFNDFISLYKKSYGASLEEQEKIKQKLQDNIYSVRFDPAFFLLMGVKDHNSSAMYIPDFKTVFFPDMKTYKNIEISLHEITHSIGSINNKPDGSKIEDSEIYVALNEGITEKMTVEMTGKKNEAYSPNVKCAQIIDIITEGKANEAFQKNDIDCLEKNYDEQINDGAFKDLVFNIHGIENILKEINKSNNVIFDFEEENDVNSAEFIEKYDAIKRIIDEVENIRLDFLKDKTEESKEKYLTQSDLTDEELKKFKDEIIFYVFAKECISKYDNGKNIDLICGRMANTLDKHLSALIDKSNTLEEQRELMQKFCNIQESFNFSENKINVLSRVIKDNLIKLYQKITSATPEENLDIYKKLGIKHNLKWLNNDSDKISVY